MKYRASNINELEKMIQPLIKKAIKNVAIRLTNEFKKYIDEDIYENNKDVISKEILSSLESVNYNTRNIKSGAGATIYINEEFLCNLKDKNGNKIDIDLSDVMQKFKTYCNDNYERLLTNELKKLGLSIR